MSENTTLAASDEAPGGVSDSETPTTLLETPSVDTIEQPETDERPPAQSAEEQALLDRIAELEASLETERGARKRLELTQRVADLEEQLAAERAATQARPPSDAEATPITKQETPTPMPANIDPKAPVVDDEIDEKLDDQPEAEQGAKPPATFDEWLSQAELDDAQRGQAMKLVQGLKSALDSERGERKKLERQVRQAAAAAEQGSKLKEQLDQLAGELSTTSLRAIFYEGAIQQGVKPKSAKLAFIAAQTDGLIEENNDVKWDELRDQYPELFDGAPSAAPQQPRERSPEPAAPRVKTNAGAGTGGTPRRQFDMNTVIRGAAGRRG